MLKVFRCQVSNAAWGYYKHAACTTKGTCNRRYGGCGMFVWLDNFWKQPLAINRATVDLQPKMRTAEENFFILPKKKTIDSVCITNFRSYLCLFIFGKHLLQQCLILDFLLVTVTENVFLLGYFLNQLNAKPSLQNQLSRESYQSRQFTMPPIPDNAFCLCAARLYYFHDIKKAVITKCLRWDRNGLNVYQILLI